MDNDLISRSALMEQLLRKRPEPASMRYTGGFNDAILRVRSMVHSAPAVDAVPVVRCQDCIHLYSLMDCPLAYVDKQMGIVSARDVDFFCKDGERKETDNG